ncbi:MAG TPA: hypothetical protein VF765_04660 [Polyangiaceae bacterium]
MTKPTAGGQTRIMWRRTVLGLVLTAGAALASCTAPVVDLGGGRGGGPGADAGGGASCDAGIQQPTCAGESDAGGVPSDGSGYSSLIAPACLIGDGTQQTPSSAAQIAQELVGSWTDCQGGCKSNETFGLSNWLAMGDGSATGMGTPTPIGIEFTSDGHYSVLDRDPNTWLLDRSAATGTFAVVDASATLGAGAYQVSFHPTAGNLFEPQILVFDSPRKIRFIMLGTANTEDLSPALPLTFRKGVCSSVALGPVHVYTGLDDLEAQLEGRWIWCSGTFGLFCGPVVGMEFTAGGEWFALTEDASGNVARSSDPMQHGTYGEADAGFNPTSCTPSLALSGPDFTAMAGGIVGQCRRALTFETDVLLPLP